MPPAVRSSLLDLIAGSIALDQVEPGAIPYTIRLKTLAEMTLTADFFRLAKDGVLGTHRVAVRKLVTKRSPNRYNNLLDPNVDEDNRGGNASRVSILK